MKMKITTAIFSLEFTFEYLYYNFNFCQLTLVRVLDSVRQLPHKFGIQKDTFCHSTFTSIRRTACVWKPKEMLFTLVIFHSFAVFCRPLCMLLNSSKKNQTVGGQIKIYILFRLVYVIF